MTTALFTLLAAQLLAAPLDGPAVELRYSGTLTPVERTGDGEPIKRFNVYCLIANGESAGRELAFYVDEREIGWPWPERFGLVPLDARNRPAGPARIQVLHEHEGTDWPLPLPFPLFDQAERLKDGAEWIDGKLAWEVVRRRKMKDRDCWQVEASTNFGRSQTLWIDAENALVVASEQRVFMGRGDRFVLKTELDSVRPLDEQQLADVRRPLTTLVKLRHDLGRPDNETKPELSELQLETARAALVALTKEAEATPFSRLVAAISRDVKDQLQRADDIEGLTKKIVGRPAPELVLKGLDGVPVDPAEYKDKIVLLHFWKYNEEPLKEPYGQVGYLDFLNSRRGRLGVQIYGVAVDSRFGDPAQSPPALRQVRKVREFMNLSYPLTVDDGRLLKKFGDPRTVGAALPLWVVITPDGRIAHYKAGFYDIKPDEGLRQLDELLIEQIRKQRGTE